jgi:hypothetical protein
MFSHLLSKLPASRPADWKCWDMSVCIAGLSNGGKELVLVSDSKAAFGDFSADKAVHKDAPLAFGYAIQFAGNDAAHAGMIKRRVQRELKKANPEKKLLPADQVAECVHQECKVELERIQEAKVLRKHGYSSDQFVKAGKELCTDSVFFDIHSELEKVKLSLDFLVAGFDEDGNGHIRYTNSTTPPQDYDSLGFWAIGRGQHSALSSISHAIENLVLSVQRDKGTVLYHLLAAKFMAESATDVGRDTSVMVVSPTHKPEFLLLGLDEYVRERWKKDGAPRVPKGVTEALNTLLASADKAVDRDYMDKAAKYGKLAKAWAKAVTKIRQRQAKSGQ